MFNSRFVLAVACAMSFIFVDFVEVQAQSKKAPIFKKPLLFRRAKEYQREQLKQELKGELYGELSDKLDKDVAVATETLRKATEAKVASESKKLQKQAQQHSSQLAADVKKHAAGLSNQHADAMKALDAQGKAIAEANAKFKSEIQLAHETAMKKHAQANKRARNRLATMFKTLTEEFQTASQEQAKANEKMIEELTITSETNLAAKVEELAKTLAKQNDEFALELAKSFASADQSAKASLEKALADLTAAVKTQVDDAVAQLNVQQSAPEPTPEPQPVPDGQEAVPANSVKPQNENNEDE